MGEFEGLERNEFEDGDYYMNELGFKVFTKQYLLKRGYCCKNGCKNCPFNFNNHKKNNSK
ncbi:MAG: hypothetical protein CMD18_01640 [Flavobacteriales bacterium]|nr:hypothetical protein [Flavobacteriales bacterium]